MKEFKNRLNKLSAEVPDHVRIIAVSKTKPIEDLLAAYEAGQRIFGENKVQEIVAKQPHMPEDVEWHMIGHVQTNKVKLIVPIVSMIHGVDSLKLLNKIQLEAEKNDRVIPCLIQVHIAIEESKFGFSADEVIDFFNEIDLNDYPNIRFAGLMGMASYIPDDEKVLEEFKSLKDLFQVLVSGSLSGVESFRELSMGMTGDFRLAIQAGSTMIRVGTLLFGSR
jgi:pyridoxal phosphate enzyme (YggS family)